MLYFRGDTYLLHLKENKCILIGGLLKHAQKARVYKLGALNEYNKSITHGPGKIVFTNNLDKNPQKAIKYTLLRR